LQAAKKYPKIAVFVLFVTRLLIFGFRIYLAYNVYLAAPEIILHGFYQGMKFFYSFIWPLAFAIFKFWLYEGIGFFFLSIWLPDKFRNIGLRWEKQYKSNARNYKSRPLGSFRWISTFQYHLLLPRVEVAQKIKRGIRGFANGHPTTGIADTGAAQNVVSLAFAQNLGLDIEPSTHEFQFGSSKQIISLGETFPQNIASRAQLKVTTGTVQFQWAFSEDSRGETTLNCHVLKTCIYDLILGRMFFAETQTLSRYQHRFSQCAFPISKSFKFGLLGETFRRIEETLGSHGHVLALPDTGAERNLIDFQ
jgi:hypothetical protein